MSQIPAITNETLKAPEPGGTQRSDDKFSELLEKEKLKTLFPSMLPINFQSFFNVPLFSGFGGDKAAGKIDDYSAVTNYYRRNSTETSGTDTVDRKPNIKEQKQEQTDKTAQTPKQAKVDELKFMNNAINKTFAGELELSADFYDSLINAKNNIDSLRKVDVDDLVAQIKNKIKFLSENGKIELSIELKPENLGTILMNISSNKGVLSINIYADQAAKQVLEENIAELERSLKLANLNIESLNLLNDSESKYDRSKTG